MYKSQSLVADALSATVDELYREHGVWKTAHALVMAAWRRRRMKNHISDLSNRMRRDIGVPESEDAPGEARRSFWDVRL
ncbi:MULTISPECIES: DUF1127 domain-containing protein [Rhizobium/Agrobacterium group]|uniref:DUF1127 domain-containing protein n=2 Tax=Neorhizobium TaxID=1525371 RepID=A0ABV0MCG3_9HYPH|nr:MULTISPECIES: DUF1127 domain-containing protein [Rhizobium/Agrobacterium group]KGD94324.1 hypothetical protein JL39_20885 [Rhizobium sp. YS-1r]MCC2609848.1 DUF1127 domain-containing protein [Neorhizobium petrolearium]WGI70034.1 DUF1127 domain-containing protein [Neorhizobium petrolearium]